MILRSGIQIKEKKFFYEIKKGIMDRAEEIVEGFRKEK